MTDRAPIPRWVTRDALCLLFAGAVVLVTIFGGFRVRLFGVRLGVTSPLPLLFWSLGIGVIRHVAACQQPLYRQLPQQLAIPPTQRSGWIASFAAVQAFNAAVFYTWRPLF